MSKLVRNDVLKLARLSRLKLSDEEVERFTRELNEIIAYVEVLDSVDVSDLSPTYQVTGLHSVTRADRVKDFKVSPKDLLANAPATEDQQFKVKRVIE